MFAALGKRPFVQHERTVHSFRQFEVVGGDERGEPLGMYELDQGVEHAGSRAAVKISGRLVRQQYSRSVGKGTRHRDPLLPRGWVIVKLELDFTIAARLGRVSRTGMVVGTQKNWDIFRNPGRGQPSEERNMTESSP